MNWTPNNIFEARDKYVTGRDGQRYKVKLDAGGWYFISAQNERLAGNSDIWSACAFLNRLEAEMTEQEATP